ncbi:hypothetical protein FGADI_2319 [Fusarium gaditjirri]|uniref:Uncharacterized protein n=1 Tax=Fusarium gaditjirri TaxID=282569 RepID=A0A8H4X2C4_9HYPO|nr:hypothetical protein FGADI_2319 [Fusarium gaditjirri]
MSEPRRKRVAMSAPQNEPSNKRAHIDEEEDDGPSVGAFAHATHLLNRRPPLRGSSAADIVQSITQPTPEGWSADDETAASDYWDGSLAKLQSANINQGQHAALLALFKTSIRVLRIAPITMISPIHCLRYQPVSKDNSGLETIYSPAFCTLLAKLIVHPCFGGKKDHITWALQYAVACRIDDRRAWPHEQYIEFCPALELVSQRIGDSDAPESIHAMHISAREEVVALGDRDPDPWSDFLYHLGQTVAGDESPRPPVDEKFRESLGIYVLPITLWDLQALEKAVDSMEWPQKNMRYPVSEAWSAWKAARRGQTVPTIKQLPQMFELLHKDIFRQTYDGTFPVPSSEEDENTDFDPLPSQVGGFQAPSQSELDDSYQDGTVADIPIDDMPMLPADDAMEICGGNVSDLPRERTPSHPESHEREPRHNALADGESTEDDQLSALSSFPGHSSRLVSTPVASENTLTRRLQVEKSSLERRVTVLETEVSNLQAQIDQMSRDSAHQQTEWAERFKALELEKSTLLARIPDNALNLARKILAQNPPVNEATVNRILGEPHPHFDNDWTRAKEDAVERKFQTAGHLQSSEMIEGAGFKPLRELWRVSLRIFGEAPPIMLSRLSWIQFVPESPESDSRAEHVLTPQMCRELSALIVHPIWQQDSGLFVDALTFAAVCRLNVLRDLRQRFGDKAQTCPALRRLNTELDSLDGNDLRMPLHDIHKKAREATLAEDQQPSALSDLLFQVGRIATHHRPSAAEEELLRDIVVPFNEQDTKALKEAIDSTEWSDPGFDYKVTDVYQAFKGKRGTDDMPLMSQLRKFHVRAVKQALRIESCSALRNRPAFGN